MKPIRPISDTIGARGSKSGSGGGGTASNVLVMQPYGHAGKGLSQKKIKKLRDLQKKHGISKSNMKYMIESVNRSKGKK